MTDKLRDYFDEMVVFKDLKNNNIFSSLGLPSFSRDWLLRRFEDEDGRFDADELADFARQYIPRQGDWNAIKSRLVKDHERIKMLTKLSIDVNIQRGDVSFALPVLGLSPKETIIEDYVWQKVKKELTSGQEVWGMIELGYREPDESARPRIPGKIRLLQFQNFCPYTMDLEYYKDARAHFDTSEWIDILLGAIDYNADGYRTTEEKLTMLTRLLPFAEPRLNLIELAPKGTGKSYLYGRVSRYSWLSSGGVISRAKMFYDKIRRTEGYISYYDVVTLDEVQTITFSDMDEVRSALKGYLENGDCTVDDHKVTAWAGMVICGNISKELMDNDATTDMFVELPPAFHESALLERFHGFIKGWRIPRMNNDLKVNGWALNSEYFCSILHELRSDATYRAIVDELVEEPDHADTRDTEAVKRIATAYLKLLFPNVRQAEDISPAEFHTYCLKRACKMRSIILSQIALMDREYAGRSVPRFEVRGR